MMNRAVGISPPPLLNHLQPFHMSRVGFYQSKEPLSLLLLLLLARRVRARPIGRYDILPLPPAMYYLLFLPFPRRMRCVLMRSEIVVVSLQTYTLQISFSPKFLLSEQNCDIPYLEK